MSRFFSLSDSEDAENLLMVKRRKNTARGISFNLAFDLKRVSSKRISIMNLEIPPPNSAPTTFWEAELEQATPKRTMGASQSSSQSLSLLEEQNQQTTTKNPKKLALIPLIFLIYFEVAGGPYGEESAVGAAGPLLAILGFLIFPFIWSIPEALITAELATTFPGNGGFVIWAHNAFGPFWGSLMGSWKFLSGVINLASYPVLCIDYLKLVFPIFSSGVPRYLAILFSTLLLSFLNYTGLTIVGYTAVCLGIVSLSPFLVMSLISIPKIEAIRWISLGQKGVKKDWRLFFNTLFWNLNFWDNASTLAGEVDQPQKTYPRALFSAGILTCLAYLIPLLAATGALPLDQEKWVDGHFADVAEMVAGKWLKYWIEFGAVLSVIGLYEAQLSSCAYQILGMADIAALPRLFGVRKKMPTAKRPYKVPLPFVGLVIMCLVPSGFLVYVMTVATKMVYLVSGLLTLFGIGWYFFMKFCKSKKLIAFNSAGERDEDEGLE
ncbi:hypothetical protein F0562_001332 [Nyssa sinensis]|uniref:Amino acid permease/ SLC12A domain-containing protein n=1 Tax=Nyssa sinensis TaxID=561372 RepID=A0A5J5C6R0_9ASTE|nr:hypothetical protein F0562_001332 [Nyssa sinensis]